MIFAGVTYLAFTGYLNNRIVLLKNIYILSLLGSLDVVKTLNEYPNFYKVLCILLIWWGILQASVKHCQLKLLQKHC